jgi:hypothetical protein
VQRSSEPRAVHQCLMGVHGGKREKRFLVSFGILMALGPTRSGRPGWLLGRQAGTDKASKPFLTSGYSPEENQTRFQPSASSSSFTTTARGLTLVSLLLLVSGENSQRSLHISLKEAQSKSAIEQEAPEAHAPIGEASRADCV